VPPDNVININFPNCYPEEVQGVLVARQGKRNQGFLRIEGRKDGRGNDYYWIGFERAALMSEPGEGTDLAALAARCVSVTPLRLDLTDDPFAAVLAEVLR
jgi:5'-nucleotidase